MITQARFTMPAGAWHYVSSVLGGAVGGEKALTVRALGGDDPTLYDWGRIITMARHEAYCAWWRLYHGERRYVGDRDYRRPSKESILLSAGPLAAARFFDRILADAAWQGAQPADYWSLLEAIDRVVVSQRPWLAGAAPPPLDDGMIVPFFNSRKRWHPEWDSWCRAREEADEPRETALFLDDDALNQLADDQHPGEMMGRCYLITSHELEVESLC